MARRLREADAMVGDHLARDAVQEIEENLTFGERLADRFAALNGSWLSIGGVLAATLAWVAWNAGAARAFDPFPFVLFNLVLAVAVALQGPLLMMSQNRQARRDRAQAAADFRVNLKNELGIQALVQDVGRLERKVDGLRTGREG
jgi:CRP/FNR family cyclic AMP-dependent transcriptional regulator